MGTINVRVSDELEARYNRLAKETGRTKTFYITKALSESLDDMEDAYLALNRLENQTGTVSLDELKQEMED